MLSGGVRLRRLALAAILSWAPAVPAGAAAAQEFEAELRAAQTRVEAARAAGLHLLAPRHFQRAAERLAEARERYGRGASIRAVRESLDAAREALAEAERLRETGLALLGDALEAREQALAADAPRLAPRLWERAERELLEAGRRLERGEREESRVRGAEARALFRQAELEAIRSEVLGSVLRERARAAGADAHRWAPATFAQGDSLLAQANRVLAGDRTRLSEAGRLGQAAGAAFRRSLRIALAADSVRRGRLDVETVVRRDEDTVARLAEQLRFAPDVAGGVPAMVAEAAAAIRSLQEDRASLQRELAQREEELRETRATVDSLESRLAGLERREAELAAELREREHRERRLREVRAIFSPEEGEVLLRGDSLLIRLFGLTFETGSHEIRPEHFSLLTKLQRAIREFPDAPLVVEGHTDSRGNVDFNRALSQRRAIAVREYLLTNMPISSARIQAVGHGQDRPIASNETAEGRAKNRRIEVVLDLSGG